MSKDILKSVIERNEFFRTNFHRAAMVALISVIVNLILIITLIVLISAKPTERFFAVNNQGELMQVRPTEDAVVSNQVITGWVYQNLAQIYAIDFVNYKRQLQMVEPLFTPQGWRKFSEAFSVYLDTIRKDKLVSSLVIKQAPVIIGQGTINGVYTWRVQIAVEIRFAKENKSEHKDMLLTLNVQRVVAQNNDGRLFGIAQVIQQPLSSNN